MQICITKLTIIGLYYGLMPCRHQAIIWTNSGILLYISFIRSHVTYNSGTIWKIDWTPRNKLQWNINQNSYIFIQENPFENVVWKMVAIFSCPQCVMNTGVYTSIHTWSGLLLLESSHMSLLIKIKYHVHTWCWGKYLVHKNTSKSSRVACTMTCKALYPPGPESILLSTIESVVQSNDQTYQKICGQGSHVK